MKGAIIQKGAFNPIHRMHKKIADDAIKRFPDYPHTMQMSMYTCDKGVIPVEELLSRCVDIDLAGYDATYTESGLFLDCIKEVREQYGPDLEIIFPCGEDTLQRFFRDWHAFYDPISNPNHWMKYTDYINWFKNVKWYVSRRKTNFDVYNYLVDAYLREHNNIIWSDLDLDDISSTKIRNGDVRPEEI